MRWLGKRLGQRLRRDDRGFTLIELIVTISLMGVVVVAAAGFLLIYIDTYGQTATRLSDSHDMQQAATYFSNDVANTGLRNSGTNAPVQSVWIAGALPSGAYCASTLGTPLLVLKWDNWSVAAQTGVDTIDTVTYYATAGTLRRAFCAGGNTPVDIPIVDNLLYPDPGNGTPVTCSSNCTSATPPTTISLKLSIKDEIDQQGIQHVTYVTLTGQRRQSLT